MMVRNNDGCFNNWNWNVETCRKARQGFDPVSNFDAKVSKRSRRESVISKSRECECTFAKSQELIYRYKEFKEKESHLEFKPSQAVMIILLSFLIVGRHL